MKNLISVIIPVYNVECYLSKCIDSILAQSNANFELLLIDDGSSDGSGKICDEYVKKDSRIRVFHKENGGTSSARNLGLINANGDWISFIDSDDWVSDDFLSLPENLKDVDVIEKPHITWSKDYEICSSRNFAPWSVLTKRDDIFKFIVNDRLNPLWNKIISRSLIGDTKFEPRAKIGQDFLFFFNLIDGIKRYMFHPVGQYHYYLRPNSATFSTSYDSKRAISITIDDIKNINRLELTGDMTILREAIIATTYIGILHARIKDLSVEERDILEELFIKTNLKSLKYTPLMKRIRFMVKKYMTIYHIV